MEKTPSFVSNSRRDADDTDRLNRTLMAHSHSAKAMMHAEDESAYLREVCRIIVEDCGLAMAWIGYAEEDAGKTVRPVASAGFEEGYLETLKVTWADTERGRGPTGTAIRTGKPGMCRNMLTDPLFAPWRAEAIKRGYASSLVLPLLNGEKAFGAVNIYARDPDPFSEDEVTQLTGLVDDLVYGINALRLRRDKAEADLALKHSEERYRSLVDLSPEAILVNRNNRIVFLNPAALELFGASDSQQILGKSPFDVFHPDSHAGIRQRIELSAGLGEIESVNDHCQ